MAPLPFCPSLANQTWDGMAPSCLTLQPNRPLNSTFVICATLLAPLVPYKGHLRNEVDGIHRAILNKDGRSEWPARVDRIISRIFDYVRLYFPDYVGHDMRTEGRRVDEWNLTLVLRDEDGGVQLTTGGKPCYRCLACGWEGGSTNGIGAQRHHLVGERYRSIAPCTMTTPNILERLGYEPHQHQFGDPGQGSSGTAMAIPPRDSDPLLSRQVLPVSQPPPQHQASDPVVPILSANPPRHSADLPSSSLFAHSPNFIGASAVLVFRNRISQNLDNIIDSLSPYGITGTRFSQLRGCLFAVSASCANNATEAGQLSAAVARNIEKEARKMRRSLETLQVELFPSANLGLRALFLNMENEINAMETLCMEACDFPATSVPLLPAVVPSLSGTLPEATLTTTLPSLPTVPPLLNPQAPLPGGQLETSVAMEEMEEWRTYLI